MPRRGAGSPAGSACHRTCPSFPTRQLQGSAEQSWPAALLPPGTGGGVHIGLPDAGERLAKGAELRVQGRAHQRFKRVQYLALGRGPHGPDLDHFHVFAWQAVAFVAGGFQVDDQDRFGVVFHTKFFKCDCIIFINHAQ